MQSGIYFLTCLTPKSQTFTLSPYLPDLRVTLFTIYVDLLQCRKGFDVFYF